MQKEPMIKLSIACLTFLISFCIRASASIQLIAFTHPGNPMVTLRWNMVDYPGSTAYVLYKSIDGVVWEPAAANPVFRNYNAATILAYRDHFTDEDQLFYRVKVYDQNQNIVEMSNTTEVQDPVEERYRVHRPGPSTDESSPQDETSSNDKTTEKRIDREDNNMVTTPVTAWQIVPNPVHDMLNLNYTGRASIKDVINVTLQDATGKIVKRFRAASTNTRLRISVSNLHAGVYFVRITVGRQQQLNSKFIKD
jgi:Secretion system C-terminal sorting domain